MQVTVREHVAQIIHGVVVLRVHLQNFAKFGFSLVILLLLFKHRGAGEHHTFLFLFRGAQFFGLIDGLGHFRVVLGAIINLRDA